MNAPVQMNGTGGGNGAGAGARVQGFGPASAGHAPYVHLRVRSCYSLLEGAVRPKELAKLAHGMNMPAVAVTDTNNLFGVFEIADTLAKNGVQPIVGVTLSVDFGAAAPQGQNNGAPRAYPSVALLVKD